MHFATLMHLSNSISSLHGVDWSMTPSKPFSIADPSAASRYQRREAIITEVPYINSFCLSDILFIDTHTDLFALCSLFIDIIPLSNTSLGLTSSFLISLGNDFPFVSYCMPEEHFSSRNTKTPRLWYMVSAISVAYSETSSKVLCPFSLCLIIQYSVLTP